MVAGPCSLARSTISFVTTPFFIEMVPKSKDVSLTDSDPDDAAADCCLFLVSFEFDPCEIQIRNEMLSKNPNAAIPMRERDRRGGGCFLWLRDDIEIIS